MSEHDPLQPHAHEPNPEPPSADPAFVLCGPDGQETRITVEQLRALPATAVADCMIVSTGHGASGPFTFGGVRLIDLLRSRLALDRPWSQVEVSSGDGFGTRLAAAELADPPITRPILLSYAIDGLPLSRAQGLVRLIVPSETDDALRQVKWIARIDVR